MRYFRMKIAVVLFALPLVAVAQTDPLPLPGNDAATDLIPQPCADFRPTRNLYFGDLHVHSGLSHDAFVFGAAESPAAAYADMRERLDFAAVTDHSEFLQEINMCTNPISTVYQNPICVQYRTGVLNIGALRSICGGESPLVDEQTCDILGGKVWERVQRDANEAYEPCTFSTMIGYEYSLGAQVVGGSLHRNIIFAGDQVPERVISSFDVATPEELWEELDATCLAEHGCDVLAIPHNSNQSEGEAFLADASLPIAIAARRANREPLVEIFQHKGNSECYPLVGNDDPECGFEQVAVERLLPPGAEEVPGTSFVRNALKDGLALQQDIGVNPFRMGFVGATDTHNGGAASTLESRYDGHSGARDDTVVERLSGDSLFYNPGGLTGVWAKENTRQELFDAMRRREVFATSGTRLAVRFFGSWDYPADICSDSDVISNAYTNGLPMGAELSDSPGVAPAFVTIVQRDPHGQPINEVQIIKGWLGAEGPEERVITLASYGDETDVGLACVFWRDPEFDPLVPAFYYIRAFESPSARWSTLDCQIIGVDCSVPDQVPSGLQQCCTGVVPETIRERAWGSPIWYRP